MTSKCLHGDDILAQATASLGASMGIGISIGIILSILYLLAKLYLLKRGEQSTASNSVAPKAAVKKPALLPPPLKYQASNSTTVSATSGVSDDLRENNHRYQQERPMLPGQSEAQAQRRRNKASSESPGRYVNIHENPSCSYNPYPDQHDDEQEIYSDLEDPSQPIPNQHKVESDIYTNLDDPSQAKEDDDTYLIFRDSTSSQQHVRGPASNANYSHTNRLPQQHDEDPTYMNLQGFSVDNDEYDYIHMPSVAQAMAVQENMKQGYLSMGRAPPRPPR